MITNDETNHYLSLKSIPTDDGYNLPIRSFSRLCRGITSNHKGDFYCMGCLNSFCTDNVLKKHERLCDNNHYYYIAMPKKGKKYIKIHSWG